MNPFVVIDPTYLDKECCEIVRFDLILKYIASHRIKVDIIGLRFYLQRSYTYTGIQNEWSQESLICSFRSVSILRDEPSADSYRQKHVHLEQTANFQ